MANDDRKVVSLVDRMHARSEEQQGIFEHMDRLTAALPITVDAVTRMRREVPGITKDEIARSFEIVAEEIRPSDDGWAD